MNKEIEIIEGNKLIAEFMGDPVYFTKTEGKKSYGMLCNISEVKDWSSVHLVYHESWNALMPVVEKIAEYRLAYDEAHIVCDCRVVIGIGYLWQTIINFINFYNQQTETTSQEKQS